MLTTLAKLPQWVYDRIRWDVIYRLQQRIKARKTYDFDGLFALLHKLTGVPAEDFRRYYAELAPLFDELSAEIRAVPDMTPEHGHLRHLGPEKYFRLDRSVLYCLTRAVKPRVWVETGTRFGISSAFIAEALARNGSGHLWTFDIGLTGAKAGYFWPDSQSEIGFLIPARLRQHVSIVLGDALHTLPATLPSIAPVDIYYFDSHQTYEHMSQEYRLVYPQMRKGGLFMSEDTSGNDAWPEFLREHGYTEDVQYCSHYGVSTEREVSAVRVH